MTTLAPTLQAFFTDRLLRQRHASPQTVAAYRDSLRLLVGFASARVATQPSLLDFAHLDATVVAAFLDHLEQGRGNSARTRNARLAAVHSLFRYAALRHPEHAALIERVLAIPPKRFDRALICFLSRTEVDALLASPDRSSWTGRRDRALFLLAVQTGLRASELIGLRCADVHLGSGAHVSCHGKGRKDRITPLTTGTVAELRAWLKERSGAPTDPLFPTRTGGALSRDAVEHRLTKYVGMAAGVCPTLKTKHISAHVLRHTAAMRLLQAGVDTSGHRPLARQRTGRHDTDLPARRPQHQRASSRSDPPAVDQARSVPSIGLAARLPRRALIMPTSRGRSPPLARVS